MGEKPIANFTNSQLGVAIAFNSDKSPGFLELGRIVVDRDVIFHLLLLAHWAVCFIVQAFPELHI